MSRTTSAKRRPSSTNRRRSEVWGDNVTQHHASGHRGTLVAMLVVVVGVARIRAFSLLLALVPALLPVYFVITYAGWLWFFGHNMHPWGAFTVKPFMPTVFGEGKVAQFSTYSYPYWGYALLSASALPAAGAADPPQAVARGIGGVGRMFGRLLAAGLACGLSWWSCPRRGRRGRADCACSAAAPSADAPRPGSR
jgi:hypothetical protein